MYIINHNTDGKILGFVNQNTDINTEVTNAQFIEAQKFNKIIITDGVITFDKVDWRTLEEVKEAKIQEIETAYQTAITANITYSTVVYQADEESIKLMAQNLSVGSVPTGFYWRALDNSKVPMTFVQLQGLASAIQTRGMVAFDNKVNRKDAVNAATTIAAVNAVVIA